MLTIIATIMSMRILGSLNRVVTRALCPDTRAGSCRLGWFFGILFVLAFQACLGEYRDSRELHNRRVAAHEEMVSDREKLLEELAYHQLLVEGRTRFNPTEDEIRRFISSTRPTLEMSVGRPLLVLLLGGVLVLRSVYHPKERKPEGAWYGHDS